MYYFTEYMKPILPNLKCNVLKYLWYKVSTKSGIKGDETEMKKLL